MARSPICALRTTASEPSAFSEGSLPNGLFTVTITLEGGDVMQVHVAFGGLTIPAEHAIESFRQLRVALLLDATSVHPEVEKVVFSSLISAEQKLGIITGFASSTVVPFQVVKGDFVVLVAPSMGEDSVWWQFIVIVFGQAEPAVITQS